MRWRDVAEELRDKLKKDHISLHLFKDDDDARFLMPPQNDPWEKMTEGDNVNELDSNDKN